MQQLLMLLLPVLTVSCMQSKVTTLVEKSGVYVSMHKQKLFLAVSEGDQKSVNALLAKGADVNAIGEDGDTPLHQAAAMGHLDTVDSLLAAGAEVDARDCCGSTPLHKAAERGYLAVVKFLINQGAEVNVANDLRSTPLHEAAANGHLATVEALLAAGARSMPEIVVVARRCTRQQRMAI